MVVDVVIEMPKGTKNKYEFNPELGGLELDRVLGIQVPQNYGFIPNTLAEDGDPIDAFVISDEPILSLCLVKTELVYKFECIDNNEKDDKYLGIISGEFVDPSYLYRAIDNVLFYLRNYKNNFIVVNHGPLGVEDSL